MRTRDHVDRWGAWIFLSVRLVHVAQGALCVVSGRRSYRHPRRAAGVLAVCAATTGWVLRRCVRASGVDATAARVDALVGAVGLVGLASATRPQDRTTSLNWMLPYTVGGTVALGMATEVLPEGAMTVAALASTYLATTARGHESRAEGHLTTAFANAMSYAGFYAVAASIVGVLRRTSQQLDEARELARERGERLAAEHERNRQHRLLHDSAIQTLEAVASGMPADPGGIQEQARLEASRLRAALSSTGDAGSKGRLDAGLRELQALYFNLGLECELTLLQVPDLSAACTDALVDATREALRNVLKHAGTRSAVVSCSVLDEGLKVTIRDHGKGFAQDAKDPGFGIEHSIRARIEEVGGSAEVWSEPGRGTRVTLWVPR